MEGNGGKATWFVKFQHVAAVLRGSLYDPVDAKEQWTNARKSRPPCEAYLHLLDQLYVEHDDTLRVSVHDEVCRVPERPQDTGDVLPNGIGASFNKIAIRDAESLQASVDGWVSNHEQSVGPAGIEAKNGEDGAAQAMSAHGATLWFGDIPTELASVKRLREVLYTSKPEGMPTPFFRKVIARGYRGQGPRQQSGDDTDVALDQQKFHNDASSPWFGYAFIAFRDTDEASKALEHFDGLVVASGAWKMRVQWAEAKHQGEPALGRKVAPRIAPGSNPTLDEQLFPQTLTGRELLNAVERHSAHTKIAKLCKEAAPWVAIEAIKTHYRRYPRKEIHKCGIVVPSDLLNPLLVELRRTRWPPIAQRPGMQAQHYLVLHWGKSNEGYEGLVSMLVQLLKWVDPSYSCTMVAVTKDFQGTPHIDTNDATYQYALSLGDFCRGGELCVESRCSNEVYVVDTHDKVARVDGRFIHWVKGHDGGDRFSVIFFSTDPSCATDASWPFDEDFLPVAVD